MKTISVIVPVYNKRDYIERCVKSVIGQSFKDFELILVDDGSTDGSGSVCDALGATDERIKVVHTANRGVSAARNAGIAMSTGRYLTFMDGDDCIPKGYLATLFEAAGGADIALCDVTCLKNGVESIRFSCKRGTLTGAEAIELLLSRKEINSGPCGKLFCREVVGDLSFPPMKVYEDILFVLAAFDRARCIRTTDGTEYLYDQDTGGAMSEYAKKPCGDLITMAEKVLNYLDERKGLFTPVPEYTTISHLMQHLKEIEGIKEKTPEQRALLKAICGFFYKNRKRIRKNKAFGFKERIVYLFAARGYRIKGGIRKI